MDGRVSAEPGELTLGILAGMQTNRVRSLVKGRFPVKKRKKLLIANRLAAVVVMPKSWKIEKTEF